MKLSRGVLYMAASALGFSIMGLLVKVASRRLPTGEIVFARALVTLSLSYVMVRRHGLSPWGHRRAPLMVRGALGFCGLTAYYVAIARLPLADATALQNSTPLLTAVLAWWLLDEPIGWPTAGALACGIAGVALITRPSGNGLDSIGVAVALAGVVCSSIAYVTVRKLSRTEHPLVIVFYFPLVATPLALPWMIGSFVVPRPIDLVLLLAIGVTTQIGQVCLTLGLAAERAGRAMTIGYLQVAFAMMWQTVAFGELPTVWTLGGASLILGGTLLVAQVTRKRA
ncbi:MAG TPA: DMT family transporter [Kofleriaceae bacterium]|nr:DMT family transporter [Kofleriaceae bacterium]